MVWDDLTRELADDIGVRESMADGDVEHSPQSTGILRIQPGFVLCPVLRQAVVARLAGLGKKWDHILHHPYDESFEQSLEVHLLTVHSSTRPFWALRMDAGNGTFWLHDLRDYTYTPAKSDGLKVGRLTGGQLPEPPLIHLALAIRLERRHRRCLHQAEFNTSTSLTSHSPSQ